MRVTTKSTPWSSQRVALVGMRVINALYCLLRRRKIIAPPRRILVVKLDGIGDIVLATPFLRELKRSFPSASITLVVRPSTANLVQLCPYVNRLLVFDALAADGDTEAGRLKASLFALKLWRYWFDWAVLPRWDTDVSYGYYVVCGSGAHHVTAYASIVPSRRVTWLTRAEMRGTTVLHAGGGEHEVQRGLRMITVSGGMPTSEELELWLSSEDHSRSAEWLAQHGALTARPIIALGIGATHPARCWPEDRFAALGRLLADRLDARIILIGKGEEDEVRAHRVIQLARHASIWDAVGTLTLRETAALLRRCHLFVGNDSGPMHLAAAAGIPVIEVSGLPEHEDPNSHFSPVRFGPWTSLARIVRPTASTYAGRHTPGDASALCIEAVSVEAVCGAIDDLLSTMPADSATLLRQRA